MEKLGFIAAGVDVKIWVVKVSYFNFIQFHKLNSLISDIVGIFPAAARKKVTKNVKVYLFLSIKEIHILGNQTCTAVCTWF